MTTPVRPVFLRSAPIWPLRVVLLVAALVVVTVLAIWGATWGSSLGWAVLQEKATTPAAVRLQEYHSADGRVVCYAEPPQTGAYQFLRRTSVAISCLPTWLLERPNNWVVAYPQTKPTGKVKK